MRIYVKVYELYYGPASHTHSGSIYKTCAPFRRNSVAVMSSYDVAKSSKLSLKGDKPYVDMRSASKNNGRFHILDLGTGTRRRSTARSERLTKQTPNRQKCGMVRACRTRDCVLLEGIES